MVKNVITSKVAGESCIYVKHDSGLDIYICEMPGFSTVEAILGTKYGSVNTMFRTAGDEDFTTVPEGIAHFLEHKLFENEDCGVFELYAKTGASANAMTSFDRTCYLFGCSKNYTENLRILLDFVQKPYFTQETVDKEQGIIGQEIQMTSDSPEWRVFFNMLRCMYRSHPVRIDIAGTQESIAKIDAPLLYKCYDTFYNLNNMALSVAGNVRADEVLAICDELLRPCEDNGLETVFPDEPDGIIQPEIREKQHIGKTIFNLGYKCRPYSGEERLKMSMAASLASAILTDASTDMFVSLLESELINSGFGAEVFFGDGWSALIFSGESDSPEKVRSALFAEIERISREGVDEAIFRRIKRSTYGLLIRELNNVDAVANIMLNGHLDGVGPYDAIDIVSALTAEDINNFIKNELRNDNTVLSVIEKEGGSQ